MAEGGPLLILWQVDQKGAFGLLSPSGLCLEFSFFFQLERPVWILLGVHGSASIGRGRIKWVSRHWREEREERKDVCRESQPAAVCANREKATLSSVSPALSFLPGDPQGPSAPGDPE